MSPAGISWWDCQDHFPEPTCRVSARRAEGLSGMASPKARSPRRRGARDPDSFEHGASLTAGWNDGSSRVAFHARFADWDASAVVAAEATPTMENSEAAVGVTDVLSPSP